MRIKNASKSKSCILNKIKREKFESMISVQQKFISENMGCGKNTVLWIFSDREQYSNDGEIEWFAEFDSKAKTMFEKKGYKIKGISVFWE